MSTFDQDTLEKVCENPEISYSVPRGRLSVAQDDSPGSVQHRPEVP